VNVKIDSSKKFIFLRCLRNYLLSLRKLTGVLLLGKWHEEEGSFICWLE